MSTGAFPLTAAEVECVAAAGKRTLLLSAGVRFLASSVTWQMIITLETILKGGFSAIKILLFGLQIYKLHAQNFYDIECFAFHATKDQDISHEL